MLVLTLRDYNTLDGHRNFEQWSAILDLSTRWGFASIRDLAVRSIEPPNPLYRLILARKHAVEEWILPALLELCERPEPLGLEEARLMDFEDVVLVGSVRQTVRSSVLMVDGAGIGNCVRAWKSGKPCSSVLDAQTPNNPFQFHLPQSGTPPPTLQLATVQSIFSSGNLSIQPTRASDDRACSPASGRAKKNLKKGAKKGQVVL
jgi:hypothetical protein